MESTWKWDGNYPVRCKIVDVTDMEVAPGVIGNTPDKSKPHIERTGTAYEDPMGVKINMDDGSVLYGYECWWAPIGPVEFAA